MQKFLLKNVKFVHIIKYVKYVYFPQTYETFNMYETTTVYYILGYLCHKILQLQI